MRRLIVIATLVITIVLAVPGTVLYCAAFTESGLRFIVDRLPRHLGPIELIIVNARGSLAQGVQIDRVEIDHKRVYLRFEGIRAQIDLKQLLWQTIRTPEVSVHSVYVWVKPHTTIEPPSTPHFLPPGLIIRADRVHADLATLVVPNGQHLDFSAIDTSGVIRQHSIRIFDAALAWGAATVSGGAELGAADPLKIGGNARLGLQIPGQPAWMVEVSADGSLYELPLTARFIAPFRADFKGQAADLTGNWNWSGDAHVVDFDLRAWGGGNALGLISADLATSGSSSGFNASGSITPSGLRAGTFDAVFDGSFAQGVLTAKRAEVTHRSSGAHATGAGTVAVVDGGPRLDIAGNWKEFRWPLVGKDIAVFSAAGQYTLTGIWPYDIQASGLATVPGLASVPVDLTARLAKDRLLIRSADVKALDGRASLAGEVVWAPAESWSVTGDAAGINPGAIRADLPGQLNFGFGARGEGFSSDDFALEWHGLAGRLRGQSAHGGGKLAHRGKAWEFDQVRVGLGQTSLALDGRIADQLSLRFALDTADMSLLAPQSRGQLHAVGTLHGTWRAPAVTLNAHGKGIHHEDLSLDSIDAAVDFDMSAARPSKIDLHARNLTYRQRQLTALDFTLDGTATSHLIHLDAKAPGLAVQLQAAGGFIQDMWQGRLTAFNVHGNESLHLELEAPVALLASSNHVSVQKLCLEGEPARMCTDADWTPAKWSAEVSAHELPMSTLTAGLTPSIEYRGRLSVAASASGAAAEPIQGKLHADLIDAQVSHHTSSGHIELIKLGTGLVSAAATHGALTAEVSFDAGEVGTIKGNATVTRTSTRWQDMPLAGELHAQTAELGYVTLYFPEIDKASGRIDANLVLSGTLGTPLLQGSLKLTNAELDFFQVNLALRQTAFEATLHDNALDFTGSAHIGQGIVSAHGALAWRESLPYGKFHLEGTDLRVADVPEAQIDASPNLDFTINGRQIAVAGTVKVPYAKIVPADLTGAVRSSSDEVLIGKEPEDPTKRFEVMSDITLALGDKVSIDTLGLTARLTGSLAVHDGYDNVTSGTGELSILDGKYTAYGRKLDIQRGRLIFNGGVVEDPGIDIRAIKEFPDVTAGVNVRGTLRQPRISFFSDPSLTQSQILSLLLAGGSLESVQNRQNGAAAQLLAQGGAILAQQLGSRVGIQDVGLESDLSNDTSLVLGRYLSPRLYVSYGVSLTQQLNTVKLRYSLNDHWVIKTEAGQARGADLVYTIQK